MTYSVGLDVRMLRHTGIGTYLRGLLAGFRTADNIPTERLPVLFGPEKLASTNPDFKFSVFQAPIYSLSEQAAYLANIEKCRVWHAPHYNVPVLKRHTKLVVTVHDIIHWIFRKQFLNPMQQAYAGFMLRRTVKTADHIIAVSQNTKQDLIEHFHASPEKISVTYEGAGDEYREMGNEELSTRFRFLREKYALPENFFLYVGLMKPHKNVLHLIELFEKLKASQKLCSALVLVGRKDKKYPKGFGKLERFRSTKHIIHLPSVEAHELLCLYNQAIALVHPSLYEGFGLTLLEAMKCGTPVISSNAASLAEVAGEAALLVDPRSDLELSEAMIRVETDPATRDALRAKGLERVQAFHWVNTAKQTSEVYEKVLAS